MGTPKLVGTPKLAGMGGMRGRGTLPGGGGSCSRLPQRLTNIFRCRAQTKPSPPLFPGPQTTSTAGWLVVKELGG